MAKHSYPAKHNSNDERPPRRRRIVATLASVTLLAGFLVANGAAPSSAAEPASAVRTGFTSTNVGASDDGSYPCASTAAGTPTGCTPTQVPLGFPINFFGTTFSGLYINNNGNLTFGASQATFNPFPLQTTTSAPMIAPFFADVDTRTGAAATFGTATIGGNSAFAVTWPGVGCYNETTTVKDDFQVVITNRADIGTGDFDVEFNYNQMQWDAGQSSGGNASCLGSTDAARVGFTNGAQNKQLSYELAGSGTNNLVDGGTQALTSHSLNSIVAGRYDFTFRNGLLTGVTSLSSNLTSGTQSGANISVTAEAPVTNTATLSNATATAGGTISYAVYSNSLCSTQVGSTKTINVTNGVVPAAPPVSLPIGTYYLLSSYSGDASNTASTSICGANILTVTAIPLTITANNQAKFFGAADPSLTFTVTGLLPGDSLTTNPTCSVTGTHVNAGTYPITCTGGTADPTKYTIGSHVAGTLTIKPAPVTITANNQSKNYGAADPAFTYTVAGLQGTDQLSANPTCTVVGPHANAGTYPITCSGAAASSNYAISYVAGTLTVVGTVVTITADNQSKVYGTADPAFTYTVSGLQGTDTLTTPPTCTVVPTHANVGSYPISCSGADAGGNYTIRYVSGTLAVTPAALKITPDNQSKVYGTADPAFTFNTTGLVGSDTLSTAPTCGVTAAHASVGSYTITCSGATAGSNYTVSYGTGTLTVNTATLTVTADNQSKVYGATDPAFTFSVTGLQGVDSFTTPPTCGVTGTHGNVGSYPITCSGGDAGSDYTVTYLPGTLSITPATVTITADNQTKVYGTADPAFTYGTTGLVGSDTLTTPATCTVSGAHANVGSYPITCSGAGAGDNYTVSYVDGTLSITPATVTITADSQMKVYGTVDPAFTYSTSGLIGSDSLTTPPTCTVNGAHANVGSYPITCSGAGAGDNYTVSYVDGTLSITPATVTITADSQMKVYGTVDPAFTYSTSGLIGSDSLTTPPTCTVNGAHADVGAYPITCSGASAGDNYTVSYVDGTLSITPATVTITADNKSKVYGTADPAFTSVTTGLVGTDTLTTPATCGVSGPHTNVGAYPIACSGADGGPNYTITYVDGTLTVSQAPLTITPNNQSEVYGTSDPAFTYSVSGLVGSDTVTTPPTCGVAGAHTDVGTYSITCSGAVVSDNYALSYGTGTLTVTPAALTVKADDQSKVFGAADPSFTYMVSGLVGSDTLTTPAVCGVSGAHANVGSYPITCSGADAGPNYTIGYQPGTLTVTTAVVTITADNQTKVYGTADPAFTYSVTGLQGSDTLTTPPTCSVSGAHANVGSYPIACSGAVASGNYAISYATGTLTVTPATITITADNQTKVYGTADPAFTYTVDGLVPGDSLTSAPTCSVNGAHANVGSYPIACSSAVASGNYDISYVNGSLSVTPATVTVTADNQTKTYGTPDPAFTYTVTGLVGSDTLTTPATCTVSGAHANVGSYPITCSGADAGANYTIAYAPGTLTVNQAAITVTADNQTKVYGTADPAFTYTVSGLSGSDSLTTTPTCTVSGAHANVGSYPITCSGADAGANYTVAYVAGTLSVTPATVTITADNQSTVYGTADPAFTYTVNGLVGSDTLTTAPTCTVNGAHANVGSYPITCSGASAGANYTVAYVAGTLSVTPATVNITANNQTKTYGTADPAFTYTVTGLVGSDTLTGSPTCGVVGPDSNVGTYPINCSGATASGNYTISYTAGTLTVTPAALTITADGKTKVYGTTDPAFTYTVTGLVGSDRLTTPATCGVSGVHSNVGTYPITCSGAAAGANYTISYTPGTLTVTPATVTITANNKSKTYGSADPAFTYTVSGLVGSDTLTTPATCTVSGAHANVGTYPITCSGAAAGANYTVAYAPGTLTVTAGTPTITTTPSGTVPFGGTVSDSAALAIGSGTTSGTVTFTLYGPNDATCAHSVASATGTVSGGHASSGPIAPTLPGTYQWVARYSGDLNTNPVSSSCGEAVIVTPQNLTGRAYGLSLGLSVLGISSYVLKPTPDTGAVNQSAVGTVAPACLSLTGAISVQALCSSVTTSVVPGKSVATAGLAGASIGYSALPVVALGAVSATSTTTCAGSTGSVMIAYLKIGGVVVISKPTTIAPNTTLSVAGVSVVLNQQIPITSPDRGLTVNAVVVKVSILGTGVSVVVSSAESDISNCP